jgi:hypothetical protein
VAPFTATRGVDLHTSSSVLPDPVQPIGQVAIGGESAHERNRIARLFLALDQRGHGDGLLIGSVCVRRDHHFGSVVTVRRPARGCA